MLKYLSHWQSDGQETSGLVFMRDHKKLIHPFSHTWSSQDDNVAIINHHLWTYMINQHN